MEKLKTRESEFDRLCPAHNGSPIAKDIIDDYIALAKLILSGEAPPEPTVLGFGMPSTFGGDEKLIRYKYGRASFVMSR